MSTNQHQGGVEEPRLIPLLMPSDGAGLVFSEEQDSSSSRAGASNSRSRGNALLLGTVLAGDVLDTIYEEADADADEEGDEQESAPSSEDDLGHLPDQEDDLLAD
ncbi:unnamed protein product [Amoebophrya sp. A25]|nr:unnamed protein product [Amoebophrya sp. A25]|eukprot:GSA25T00008945001.1